MRTMFQGEDSLDIFEENDIEIFVDENNNQDETFILDESDLAEESDYNSSQVCMSSEEDDVQLDKNGKRGECGETEDEEDDEHLDKNSKRGECGANGDEDDEDKDDDEKEEFAIWTSHSF